MLTDVHLNTSIDHRCGFLTRQIEFGRSWSVLGTSGVLHVLGNISNYNLTKWEGGSVSLGRAILVAKLRHQVGVLFVGYFQ